MPRRLAAVLRRARPERVLTAVRMAGTGVVAALGQLVVDMPTGYFGALEQTTVVGLAYAAVMLVGTLACGLGVILGYRGARWIHSMLVLVGLAFFLPAFATDVAVAASIVGWLLATLSQVVFTDATAPRRALRLAETAAPYLSVVIHLLLLSLFVVTLVAGFEVTEVPAAKLTCLALATLAIASSVAVLRGRALVRWLVVAGAGVVATAVLAAALMPTLAALGVLQLGLLALALVRGPTIAELVRQFIQRPALLTLTTFAAVAVTGGVALTFPAAGELGRIGLLDALFTSVSATCVTGLVVVDTPTAFTAFGEVVILVLIQVGGLGIMVLSTFATVILGGRLTLRGEQALGYVLDLGSPQHAYRLVRFIVLATLGLELVGAAVLVACYLRHGLPLGDAVWRGVFQAVSAFCNAGFSLQSDSIVMFASDPVAMGVHAALIVFGGLGFVVLAWLWWRVIRRDRSRASVQVRVVLVSSVVLVVLGGVAYAALEWNQTLAGLSAGDRLLNAFFQSVSMRTAGFNSVDIATMRPATVLLTIVLMFIGASPGGTGGGIKTTTVAVLGAAIPEIVGTRRGTTLLGRVVPTATLQRAASIAVVATLTMVGALFVLLITEDAPFAVLAFETVSALGTVGLSLGITGSLTATGKCVIIATMFIGRVGPLTLALALGERSRSHVGYPETRIMVG
jgi:trk system potassium uptake protein TrkH